MNGGRRLSSEDSACQPRLLEISRRNAEGNMGKTQKPQLRTQSRPEHWIFFLSPVTSHQSPISIRVSENGKDIGDTGNMCYNSSQCFVLGESFRPGRILVADAHRALIRVLHHGYGQSASGRRIHPSTQL